MFQVNNINKPHKTGLKRKSIVVSAAPDGLAFVSLQYKRRRVRLRSSGRPVLSCIQYRAREVSYPALGESSTRC